MIRLGNHVSPLAIDSGIPNWAKNCLSRCMVIKAVAVAIGKTSIHFNWASITTRKIFPSIGPAKSTCNHVQGQVDQHHGCRGAIGGDGQLRWQYEHCLTMSSIAWSIPGHHTKPHATSFVMYQDVLHGLQFSRHSQPGGGTTTLPYMMHPSYAVPDIPHPIWFEFTICTVWPSFPDVTEHSWQQGVLLCPRCYLCC